MKSTRVVPAIVATLLVGTATAFAPAASAGNVGWSVSVGVPGLAVTAGEPVYYGAPYRPYYRPFARPVVVAAPVVVAPPVVYAPYRYLAPAPVVYRPYPRYAPRAVVYAPHPWHH